MLVTFEGQSCSGKSALVSRVYQQLRGEGVSCSTVAAWSSDLEVAGGPLLWDELCQPPVDDDPVSVIRRAMEIVQSLYCLDEQEIGPALVRNAVVLADRHMDSLIYTLAPSLGRLAAYQSEARAAVSLGLLLSELRHKPTITIYVDASLPTRVQRIEALRRGLYREHSMVPASTIEMFDSYARVAQQLISADPDRFMRVDNDVASLDEVARSITDTICARIGAGDQAVGVSGSYRSTGTRADFANQ